MAAAPASTHLCPPLHVFDGNFLPSLPVQRKLHGSVRASVEVADLLARGAARAGQAQVAGSQVAGGGSCAKTVPAGAPSAGPAVSRAREWAPVVLRSRVWVFRQRTKSALSAAAPLRVPVAEPACSLLAQLAFSYLALPDSFSATQGVAGPALILAEPLQPAVLAG